MCIFMLDMSRSETEKALDAAYINYGNAASRGLAVRVVVLWSDIQRYDKWRELVRKHLNFCV